MQKSFAKSNFLLARYIEKFFSYTKIININLKFLYKKCAIFLLVNFHLYLVCEINFINDLKN